LGIVSEIQFHMIFILYTILRYHYFD